MVRDLSGTHMKKPPLSFIAWMSLTAALPAATSVYTDYSAFVTGLSSVQTESFNSKPLETFLLSPIAFTNGPFTYSATALNDFFTVGSVADVWLSSNVAFDSIVFNFPSGTVYGVGGSFFPTNFNGAFVAGDVVLQTNDLTTYTLSASAVSSFVGFVSTDPITSLSVTSVQPGGSVTWPTINDLVVAKQKSTAVPETGSSLLGFMLVVAGMGVAARRIRG